MTAVQPDALLAASAAVDQGLGGVEVGSRSKVASDELTGTATAHGRELSRCPI